MAYASIAWGQHVPGAITISGYSDAEKGDADPLTIEGPTEAEVGDRVELKILGTPGLDRTIPLEKQDAWLIGPDRMVVYLMEPGKLAEPMTIFAPLVVDTATGEYRYMPLAIFEPDRPGEYRLAVDWNRAPNQYVGFLVTVGGDPVDPEPDPDPDDGDDDPPLPPVPDQMFQVMIFHESNDLDNLTRGQLDMISGLVFRNELEELGHTFEGGFDRDSIVACVDGVCHVRSGTDPTLRIWWDNVDGHPLPCVAIAPIQGGSVEVFDLPADAAAMLELLAKEGQR